jgi:hypothetical protein
VQRHCRSIDSIARRMFGFEMPPVVSSATGDDLERRHALAQMTDIMVERVIQRRSRRGANAALNEMSETLSSLSTFHMMYDHRAAARNVSHLRRYRWLKGWKNHFRVMVMATEDVYLIESKLEANLPTFLFRIETTDE